MLISCNNKFIFVFSL